MAGDKVELLIGGTIYAGWKGVSVRRSLDYFADSFMLELTDSQAGSARTIKLGSPCRVLVGGEKLITGFIDRIGSGYDGNSRRLSVAGRSRTADLVDCSLPADQVGGAQKNNRTLLELAGSVCGLLGIAVSSTVAGLPPRLIANIEIEQSFYEFLECQARLDGVMLVSDPDGNLVITRASDERVGTALILGDNIETADGELSDRDRFSHYYVAAQGAETDDSWGESAAHVTGLAEDPRVRYRPTSILLTSGTQAEAKRYADWQRNVRYGRSRQATYTVAGWRHRDGLWRPNTRVLVKDDWLGFTGPDGKGEWLMIGSVEFILDDGGRRTMLTVMPAQAFDLIPLPAKAKKDEEGAW